MTSASKVKSLNQFGQVLGNDFLEIVAEMVAEKVFQRIRSIQAIATPEAFAERLQRKIAEEAERHRTPSGMKALAKCMGVSERTASKYKHNFTCDAVWQYSQGSKIYFNPEKVQDEWKTIQTKIYGTEEIH